MRQITSTTEIFTTKINEKLGIANLDLSNEGKIAFAHLGKLTLVNYGPNQEAPGVLPEASERIVGVVYRFGFPAVGFAKNPGVGAFCEVGEPERGVRLVVETQLPERKPVCSESLLEEVDALHFMALIDEPNRFAHDVAMVIQTRLNEVRNNDLLRSRDMLVVGL